MKYRWSVYIPFLLLSCTVQEEKTDHLFDLISSSESGITFTNSLKNKQLNIIDYLYYFNGGGVAVGDINNDGLDDIYFTSNENDNQLYLNLGDFKFRDITKQSGVSGTSNWSTGVTMVDVNNDGLLDIYTCAVGDYKGLTGRNELFVNNGDLTFTESARAYGLDFQGFATQAAFFDFDKDGDLDVYLLNHSVHSVGSYGSAQLRNQIDAKAGDKLYRNLLSEGIKGFEDITSQSGIYSSQIGYGLGVAVGDVDEDGWQDIYISNDFHENDYLYINQRDGTFKEELQTRMGHTSRYSMGNDIADLNGDGKLDIVTLDMLPGDPGILLQSAGEDKQEVNDIKMQYGYGNQYVRNAVQVNIGEGQFREVGQLADIQATDWSWSAVAGDLDNDGSNDLFISNGIFKRPNDLDYIQYIGNLSDVRYSRKNKDSLEFEMIRKMPSVKIPNYVYRNSGRYSFEEMSEEWGLNQPSFSNGSALADLDNDGDLDIIVNNVNQPAFLYRNSAESKIDNNYLEIELKGDKANYFGIGAKVTLYIDGRAQVKELTLTHGFQSASAPKLHFGLGQSTTIDSLWIDWPVGGRQKLINITVNQSLKVIQQKTGETLRDLSYQSTNIFEDADVQLAYSHRENSQFKDYSREYLIPYKLSTEGPAFASGDINGDGLEDIFLGGANGQASGIYIQTVDGKFAIQNQPWSINHANFEDVDATFFDADEDADLDLYVVSGGNEYREGSPQLKDRLYLNDGKGNFSISEKALPNLSKNGAVVRPADFDQDGDLDLFVGSRSIPGDYGLIPESHILINENGQFEIYQSLSIGMVTDASWVDMDDDKILDLVVVGDWMPITILRNTGDEFEVTKGIKGLQHTEGWWRCVETKDINGDGRIDIVAGNIGENIKLKPSLEEPLTMYVGDFDNNGKSDPVIFYYLNNRIIPLSSKDLLGKQMPLINKKFNSYADFSKITKVDHLLGEDVLDKSSISKVYDFKTRAFINNGAEGFSTLSLPREVQFSAVKDILIKDINNDEYIDILMVGNFFGNSIDLGRQDAQAQVLLLGTKSGAFEVYQRGVNFENEEYRTIAEVLVAGAEYLFGVRNNDSIRIMKINSDFN